MNIMSNLKSFGSKVVASKPVQAFANSNIVNKAVEFTAASALALNTLAISASAADVGGVLSGAAGAEKLISTCSEYVEPMIYITCGAGAFKLIRKMIKGAL